MSERTSLSENISYKGFATRAIHTGCDPDPQTGAVNVPIYATSTYAQDGVGGLRSGYEYSRTGNPTRTALEHNLAALEHARFARAYASGMAATDTLLRAILRPGDHIIIPNDAYGGTFRLIDKVLTKWNIRYSVAAVRDPQSIAAQITDKTTLIWVETPTNPLLSISPISQVADVAHAHGLTLVVDNTFATPYLQTPLTQGADVVVHSTTKYLGGHSDVIGGAVITNDAQLDQELAFLQNGVGAVPGPFDAYLTLRGIKTLALRMEKHSSNALALATELERHPAVTQVLYPGLPSHPDYQLARHTMRLPGGMIALRVRGGREAAQKLCYHTQIFTLAESLGGVESLIEHPAAMTHASTSGSLLEVPDDLVRLSVGIEEYDDLYHDLVQALEQI